MESKNRKFNLENIDFDFFESGKEVEEHDVDLDTEKKIEPYLELDYPIKLTKDRDEQGTYWIAEYPDLPGCKTHGTTKEEALQNLEDAKLSWMYSYADLGKEIPLPNQQKDIDSCSGKILLRIPKELHYNLIVKAKTDGISLNQEILHLLSSSFAVSDIETSLNIINQKLDRIEFIQKPSRNIDALYDSTLDTLSRILNSERKVHKNRESNLSEIFDITFDKNDKKSKTNFLDVDYDRPFIQ